MAEQTIKLLIEYDGTDFSGWQFQPGRRTIQGEIEKTLTRLNGHKTNLIAAGRTDAGVHALGQVAHYSGGNKISIKKIPDALNYHLPEDIFIRTAEIAENGFHARYDAVYRHYRYSIGYRKSLSDRRQIWHLPVRLNMDRLKWAADYIEGEHDFSAFCVVASRKEDNRCLVYRSCWKEQENIIRYDIIANRFLHTMIRSLIGLMVRLGKGDISKTDFKKIFASGDHRKVGQVAPAVGLCLVDVGY